MSTSQKQTNVGANMKLIEKVEIRVYCDWLEKLTYDQLWTQEKMIRATQEMLQRKLVSIHQQRQKLRSANNE